MAVSSDQLLGASLFSLSITVFVYYTLWVIVLVYFLPRKYAIAIPTVLVIILITLVATFVGLTLVKSARKQKQKAS